MADINERANKRYLKIFRKYLKDKGLSEKTIREHTSNADFYLNVFLSRYERSMEDGSSFSALYDFFDYFFIRKCIWSTPYTMRRTAASIKKFYKCMYESQLISEGDYLEVKDTFRDYLSEWCEDCDAFNEGEE